MAGKGKTQYLNGAGPLSEKDTKRAAELQSKKDFDKIKKERAVENKNYDLYRSKEMQDKFAPLGKWYKDNFPDLPLHEYSLIDPNYVRSWNKDDPMGTRGIEAWSALKDKAREMYPDDGDPDDYLPYYYFVDIGNAAAEGAKDATRPYRQHANYVTNPPEQRGADYVDYYNKQDAKQAADKNARSKEAFRQRMMHDIENENKGMNIPQSIIEGVGEWR